MQVLQPYSCEFLKIVKRTHGFGRFSDVLIERWNNIFYNISEILSFVSEDFAVIPQRMLICGFKTGNAMKPQM